MKTYPFFSTVRFLGFLTAAAQADVNQAIQEARTAGEKLGFTTIHQIRASFVPDHQPLQLEESWIDLKTGWYKTVVHSAPSNDPDPLRSGNVPGDLPIERGSWKTDLGDFFISRSNLEWRPAIPVNLLPRPESAPSPGTPRDERETMLAQLSHEWTLAQGKAAYERFQGNPDAQATYGPLPLTSGAEEKKTIGGGIFSEEHILWHGLVRSSTRKFKDVTVQLLVHEFQPASDLTPSVALQEEFKKSNEMVKRLADLAKEHPERITTSTGPYDPSKPMPFPGKPRPTYGFTFAPISPTDKLEIRLRRVFPGSPADKAGLKEDDVIIAIGEQKLGDLPDRKALFAFMEKPGTGGEFTIRRGEETFKVRMEKVDSSTFAPSPQP